MAREYLRNLYPNGKKTSDQKKSGSYFDDWVKYVTICENCDKTILKDSWKYSELKIEISCQSCGVNYQFPTGKRNIKNQTPFTYNKKEKEMFGNNKDDTTTESTPVKVKKTAEQKFQEKNDRLEANITKKDEAIKSAEDKRDQAVVTANLKISLIEKAKEAIELELFRHGRSKK
jgi:hypothetical protein